MNRLLQNAMNDYEWLNEATMDVLLICFNLIVTWVSYSLEMMIDHPLLSLLTVGCVFLFGKLAVRFWNAVCRGKITIMGRENGK